MFIDLHCHSKYSHDNHLEPEDVIFKAMKIGLDGVCFTEHYSFESSRPIGRMKLPEGFLVLRGVEVSTTQGHLLVYGVENDEWNLWGRNNFLELDKVIESVHSLGGICIPAHPFRGWESIGENVFLYDGFDGIETHNGVNPSEKNAPAIKAAQKLGLPSIGGSDCHTLRQIGRACTEFSNHIENIYDLVTEIKAGRCRGRLIGPDGLRPCEANDQSTKAELG